MCHIMMDWWKVMLTWHYHYSCKLVALELHNSCSYIAITKLHKLHMYMVSHMVSYIYCNSCNLTNSTHICRNPLSCNEVQMVLQFKNLFIRLTANHSQSHSVKWRWSWTLLVSILYTLERQTQKQINYLIPKWFGLSKHQKMKFDIEFYRYSTWILVDPF
jgi:hypothetical protein